MKMPARRRTLESINFGETTIFITTPSTPITIQEYIGMRQFPNATTVERVIRPSTIITRVPIGTPVYLLRIIEITSEPPEVALARKIIPSPTP